MRRRLGIVGCGDSSSGTGSSTHASIRLVRWSFSEVPRTSSTFSSFSSRIALCACQRRLSISSVSWLRPLRELPRIWIPLVLCANSYVAPSLVFNHLVRKRSKANPGEGSGRVRKPHSNISVPVGNPSVEVYLSVHNASAILLDSSSLSRSDLTNESILMAARRRDVSFSLSPCTVREMAFCHSDSFGSSAPRCFVFFESLYVIFVFRGP